MSNLQEHFGQILGNFQTGAKARPVVPNLQHDFNFRNMGAGVAPFNMQPYTAAPVAPPQQAVEPEAGSVQCMFKKHGVKLMAAAAVLGAILLYAIGSRMLKAKSKEPPIDDDGEEDPEIQMPRRQSRRHPEDYLPQQRLPPRSTIAQPPVDLHSTQHNPNDPTVMRQPVSQQQPAFSDPYQTLGAQMDPVVLDAMRQGYTTGADISLPKTAAPTVVADMQRIRQMQQQQPPQFGRPSPDIEMQPQERYARPVSHFPVTGRVQTPQYPPQQPMYGQAPMPYGPPPMMGPPQTPVQYPPQQPMYGQAPMPYGQPPMTINGPPMAGPPMMQNPSLQMPYPQNPSNQSGPPQQHRPMPPPQQMLPPQQMPPPQQGQPHNSGPAQMYPQRPPTQKTVPPLRPPQEAPLSVAV